MLTLNDGRSELWQWDTGRTLAVDAECSQVHFSNKVFGRSIDVDVVDGVAIIPDILLQTDKDLNVWAFVGTAENGYTKISKTFKVNRRNKPSDYVFTPTDQMTLQTIQSQIGDLADLTTEAKDTLVAAINEAARTGGGGGGSTVELDTTLTQSGKAADAKAVGDRLSALSEEIVTTAESKVAEHNTGADTHSDIRLLINGLTDRLNALADSDDTTLDQLSEVVAYIKSNRTLIEAITTSKVSVADIIDNLTTNVTNKPLSAAQGVALKALIDAITVPEALPNPNALTFTGAVTGSYDGSEPMTVEIPSGGSGGSAEPGYKDAITLLNVTLDDATGGLKNYEYDVSGIEKTDVIIINILFPANYSGNISIKNQSDSKLADEFPNEAKGIVVVIKAMNGRYLHSAAYSSNAAARLDAPLSLFYGQLSGASGFERPKANDVITKIKFALSAPFASGTKIRIYRW